MATTRQSIHFVQLLISGIIQLHVLRSLGSCAISTGILFQPSTSVQEHFRLVQALILSFMKEGRWQVSPEHSEA
jgi:hypothetical protein